MTQLRSYTTIEQSKKLAEILPIESADMEYLLEHWIDEKTGRHKEGYCEIPVVKVDDDCPLQPITISCWSLSALLDVINKDFYPNLFHDGVAWILEVTNHDKNDIEHYLGGDNPLAACYEMILLLHDKNLI